MYVPPSDDYKPVSPRTAPPPGAKPGAPAKKKASLLRRLGSGAAKEFAPTDFDDRLGKAGSEAGTKITNRLIAGPVKWQVLYRNTRDPDAVDKFKGPYTKRSEANAARKQLVKQGYYASVEAVG